FVRALQTLSRSANSFAVMIILSHNRIDVIEPFDLTYVRTSFRTRCHVGAAFMRRRAAFTLVELLVVIGIIAVLVAIILPALSKARQQAWRVRCLSNAKQLGVVVHMYVHENKTWLPASNWDRGTTAGASPNAYV